MIITAILQFTK